MGVVEPGVWVGIFHESLLTNFGGVELLSTGQLSRGIPTKLASDGRTMTGNLT